MVTRNEKEVNEAERPVAESKKEEKRGIDAQARPSGPPLVPIVAVAWGSVMHAVGGGRPGRWAAHTCGWASSRSSTAKGDVRQSPCPATMNDQRADTRTANPTGGVIRPLGPRWGA